MSTNESYLPELAVMALPHIHVVDVGARVCLFRVSETTHITFQFVMSGIVTARGQLKIPLQ